MLTKRNITIIMLLALLSGALFHYYIVGKENKDFDIANEITVLSRNTFSNRNTNDNQFYKIQPAVFSSLDHEVRDKNNLRRGNNHGMKNVLPLRCKANSCEYLNREEAKYKIIIDPNSNRNQVSIKVFRKTQTDVKYLYTVTEIMLTDNGGLPLGAFPNLEQFFDGTYFPPLYSSNPRKIKAPNGFISIVAKNAGRE